MKTLPFIHKAKKLTLFIAAVLVVNLGYSQVAINEDDSNGDASSELDVKSTTKGILFPVMTTAERDAIPSPAEGLLIFNRSTGYHNLYDGSNWVEVNRTLVVAAPNPFAGTGTDVGTGVGVSDPDNCAMLHVNSTTKGFLLPRLSGSSPASPATGLIYYNTASHKILFYNGTDWEIAYTATIGAGAGGSGTAAGLLIGTGTIHQSAKMEVRTTSAKGMLIPRMTTAQRNAIDSPTEGLTIYNTSTNEIHYYMAGSWYKWNNAVIDYGQIVGNPGISCLDIYNSNPATQGISGLYYIDPDGTGANPAYQCYCDMVTDGGGWTLVENTGPKGTNNMVTGASGGTPILPTGLTFAKLRDSDINIIRGSYATSILRVEKSKACNTNVIYFKQNRIFNSAAANNSQSIRTYYTSYANAVASSGMQTGTSNYGSAFDTWTGGLAGYQIIFSYGGEGFIYSGCNSVHADCPANNRSVCNSLVWVK